MGTVLTDIASEPIKDEIEEWADEFSREEMLEQQSRLLIEEVRLLQEDLTRYRTNVAKLVDMNAEVTRERDKLRTELTAAKWQISKLNVAACENWKRFNTLQRTLTQRDEVMRQHGVPEHYFGTPASES